MKNYFDFIMYLAFRTILIYENKRSLTFKQLHDFRKKLCEKNIEYNSQFSEFDDEDLEKKLRFFHSSNINMTIAEEQENFINFVNDNKEYFYYKDGVITLKDDVTYNGLVEANFELESYTDQNDKIICGELIGIFDCVECLDILGVSKVKNFVSKLIEDEKKIESAYLTYSGVELEQNIKKLIVLEYYKLMLICNLNDDKMRCYHRTIVDFGCTDTTVHRDDLCLLSDYLMENDEYYDMYYGSIDLCLNDMYQRAIFGNGTLVYDRLSAIFDSIWSYYDPDEELEVELVDSEANILTMEERRANLELFEDEFEDDEPETEEYSDDSEMNRVELYLYRKKVEMTFYLNYIKHINKFMEIHGKNEDLENSKNRLLYLLDSYGDNLYKTENFEQALNNISMSEIDYKRDFDDFYMLSRLFLVDILEGWINDEFSLKKLLFVFSYYDLTKDKRIKKIINKYQKTELGGKVADIILKQNYSTLASSFDSSSKKLMKKKIDSENS